MQTEQAVHDRVNLARLVRRLEKTVETETWADEPGGSTSTPAWIRTRGTLQRLRSVDNAMMRNASSLRAASRRYDDLRRTLDCLEKVVHEVDKRLAPVVSRPVPILPTIPPPIYPVDVPFMTDEVQGDAETALPDPTATLLPAEESSAVAAHELLLTPSDSRTLSRGPINLGETLLPPSLPAAAEKSSSQATPAFMQNSAALQEELSAQLAQMATQLKRNAIHFAGALEKDKAVVLETQEKLERNHDVVSKERVRLRDHHSKSWSTTWITILSLLVVLVGFIMTFLVIRIT
ncbi:hypothetical protein C8Q80DRAFT_1220591 [Daedaleopsis nitida]|nr:hypothetical protein C8Q80DRAFT_1220591 [Daedaleopsis nitida]